MNKLTQVKDKKDILYDVVYDCDFERFVVWEHDKRDISGCYFTNEEIKHYIEDGQIEIVQDGNKVFEKYLK